MTLKTPADIKEIDQIQASSSIFIQKFQLANGLKIIIYEDHTAPIFAYHTWFNVGSRNEREGITGIAHLFEHLMFKETKNLKEGEFDRIIEEQGGKMNAATYVDWTFYRESLPTEAFSIIPRMEADRMENMILNERQVNSEREVVANERRFRVDNSPIGTLYEKLYAEAFQIHPYHWPVIGWMKDIQAITLNDCIEFYKTYYAPNNATVVVVGNVETQNVLETIQNAYGHIPASTLPQEELPLEPKQEKERRIQIDQTIPSEKTLIGFHVPESNHLDYPALEVAHAILFDGKSSRLYRKLVTELQIVSGCGGWVNQTKDPGLYVADITMKPGHKVEEAEKVVYQEMKRISEEAISKEELDKVKNRFETTFWGNFKIADSKAQALGFFETVAKDYRKFFHVIDQVKNVTATDIQKVAKKYYRTENRTVVIASPAENSKH